MPTLPLAIDTFSEYATELTLHRGIGSANNPASNNWPAANQAIYVPIRIPFAFPVVNAFWSNGATAGANVSVAIYDTSGTRLATTGSVAQSGTANIQYQALSYSLPAGSYYIGMSCSGTTAAGHLNASMTAVLGRAHGMLEQATAHPCPATMTGVAFASTGLPHFGLSRA